MGEISKPVMEFAKRMQYKLNKNKHKTGWEHLSIDWLRERMLFEADELKDFIADYAMMKADPKTDEQVLEDMRDDMKNECADVANFAMMIFDNIENHKSIQADIDKKLKTTERRR